MSCKGKCKWFDSKMGFGFITEDGGEEIFVHKSEIKSSGFQNLKEGEPVEFDIETGADGRKKAVKVTGPDGSDVQGAPRRFGGNRGGRYDNDRGDRRDGYDRNGRGGFGNRRGPSEGGRGGDYDDRRNGTGEEGEDRRNSYNRDLRRSNDRDYNKDYRNDYNNDGGYNRGYGGRGGGRGGRGRRNNEPRDYENGWRS